MKYFKAILAALLSPVIGGAGGLGVCFLGHWLSGEAKDIASGQPWIMMSMLFVPAGVLVGLVVGAILAVQLIRKGL